MASATCFPAAIDKSFAQQRATMSDLSKSRYLRRFSYVPVLSFSMGLMLVRTLVLARIFDVRGFAQFSQGVLVSSTFTTLGCLGLQTLLQREMPIQFARHRARAAYLLLSQCVIVAIACAIGGEFAALLVPSIGGIPAWLFALGIGHGLSQQMFLIATVESRSRGDTSKFASQSLVRGVSILFLGAIIALATRSAAWTLVVETILCFALALNSINDSWRSSTISPQVVYLLGLRHLRSLRWSAALALLGVTALSFVIYNIDRWLAAGSLIQTDFAQYAFAWTIPLAGQALQLVLNASIFPFVARTYASSGSNAAFKVCAVASIALLVGGSVVVAPSLLLADFSIRRWFPGYDGARILIPFFAGVSVLRLSNFWSSFLIVTGHEWRLFWVNVLSLAIGGGFWFLWRRPLTMGGLNTLDIAGLAVALTLSAYVGSALCAWQSVRKRRLR
jgi:O-antigen/teichoic acid export membrane protein